MSRARLLPSLLLLVLVALTALMAPAPSHSELATEPSAARSVRVSGPTAAQVNQELVRAIEDGMEYTGAVYLWNATMYANGIAAADAEAAARAEAEEAARRKQRPAATTSTNSEPIVTGPIVDIINDVFGANAGKATDVADCESSLNQYAHRDDSGASGLFQIVLPLHNDLFEAHGWNPSTSWSDPYKNSVVARDLSHGGANWSAWDCG